jgi:hypothetical protein
MARVYYKRDMKNWLKDANAVINSDDFTESVFDEWGYITHSGNNHIAEKTLKLATKIAERDGQSLDYGYYYLYLMQQENLTDEQMQEIAKIDETFEKYRNKGR